ncbi:MAG: type I DNA topoisomerase, partial [bacterium]
LGGKFQVLASGGHIYDLPEKGLGVDIENGFEPTYVPLPSRESIIKVIKETAAHTSQVYIATDPDREGEAIAYHITQAMDKSIDQVARVEFHEITSQAVKKALENPGKIQMKRVEAQQARRVLDRLVGYMVSPILWKTVAKGLSAGRVQSVALRLICEREAEIEKFISVEYWTIEGEFLTPEANLFRARLVEWQGEKILIPTKSSNTPTFPDQKSAEEMVSKLIGDQYKISSVDKKVKRRIPPPPFTTSTLQQEGNRRLKLSTRDIMAIAQTLYEGVEVGERGRLGLITYMRTDSTRVSPEANAQLRELIFQTYGDRFLSPHLRIYKNKKDTIQDAHEAIRPTDVSLTPEKVKPYLPDLLFRVYDLIWRRFVATQMREAIYEITNVEVKGERGSLFRATGSVLKDQGFLVLYPEMKENIHPDGRVKGKKVISHASASTDKNEEESGIESDADEFSLQVVLPEGLKEGLEVQAKSFIPEQHVTEPPPRYTEASLVKELDEKGIGRPSTYAVIISTLFERHYVKRDPDKRKRILHPTPLGRVVNDILVRWFPQVFSVGFTAQMENGLDRVEEKGVEWREVVREFYQPFSVALEEARRNQDQIKGQAVETLDKRCPECGAPLLLRWGKNGRFISCSRFPHCRYAESFQED